MSPLPAAVASPPVHLHVVLARWQLGPLSLVALVVELAVAGAYLWGTRRLARRGRSWSGWRTAAFLGGLAVIVVALQSGFAYYDNSVFSVHAVQHLLLMNLAPILLALGAPITLLVQASSRPAQSRIIRILHSRPARWVTHPGVAACAAMATMYVYFLSPLYALSVRSELFHYYVHLHFLAAGFLYWALIVGTDPVPHRLGPLAKIGLLVAAIPFSSFLGIALMNGPAVAPQHTAADTHAGGGILWVVGELFTFAALAVVLVQWMRDEERKTAREDRRLEALSGGQPMAPTPYPYAPRPR